MDKMREISFDEFCESIGTTKQIAMNLLREHHDPGYHRPEHLNGSIIHHHFVFCAIASSNIHVKSMFEIGTCAGNCARLLSNIFPKSLIKTLDIPENYKDIIPKVCRSMQDRDNAAKLLDPLKNVEMLEYNSAFLWKNEKESHDCIFVDGCHNHPVVFSDIMWAYFNAQKIIVFHDVGPGEPHVVESLKYLDSIVDEELLITSKMGILIKR